MSRIDRRSLLSFAAAGAAAAAACAPRSDGEAQGAADGPARATRRLRMVTTWDPNTQGLSMMAVRTADMIGKLTRGELQVTVFPAGEIVPALEAFDAVASGAADLYHGAEYYWQGKSRGFNFFTAMPMGLTGSEILGWIDYGGGQELWEELSGRFGVIAFLAGQTGHQMGGWFKREIRSTEDFRGLKMRIPGLGGDVIRELGGAAETLSGSEIFQALQSGRIDATEWVGPWNDLEKGFHTVAPYYYGPGFHEPGSMLACGINRRVWDSLPEEHQIAVRAACAYAHAASIGEYDHFNALALQTLRDEHGVELRSFPDDVWARVKAISADVIADSVRGDALAQRIYDSYVAARARAIAWSSVADGPYLAIRGGPQGA